MASHHIAEAATGSMGSALQMMVKNSTRPSAAALGCAKKNPFHRSSHSHYYVGKLWSPQHPRNLRILTRGRQFSKSSRLLVTSSHPVFTADSYNNNASAIHAAEGARDGDGGNGGNGTVHKWTRPTDEDLDRRPVLILGAGNLGRRIATVWASCKRDVTLYDRSDAALASATEFITDELGEYCARRETHPGHVRTTTDLEAAITASRRDSGSSKDAVTKKKKAGGKPTKQAVSAASATAAMTTTAPWMVIECLPEDLAIKTEALAELERKLPEDCILASNSSGLRTAAMAPRIARTERLLNTHYYLPPGNRSVELMSSGHTDAAVFPFLEYQMRRIGLAPIVVPPGVQSDGFIFNRIWAAAKRESLAVLAEGVAHPAEVDALFRDFFHATKGPCERMDEVGLDIVAGVEAGYLARRPELAIPRHQKPLAWLRRNYIEKGNLGAKTGDGLYTAAERAAMKERRRTERQRMVAEANGE